MSATPPLQERSGSPSSRYHIRVVPYSPPRLSSDGSAASSSRPLSYADLSPSQQTLGSSFEYNDEENVRVQPGAEQSPEFGVSVLRRSPGFGSPSPSPSQPRHSYGGAATASPTSPLSPTRRARKVITLHPDKKTFSVALQSGSLSSRTDSLISPPSSYLAPSGSYRSSDAFVDETPSSPLTPLTEKPSLPDLAPPSASGPATPSSAAGNHQLVGGLRKVPTSPEAVVKQPNFSPSIANSDQTFSPEVAPLQPAAGPSLSAKTSTRSLESSSTLSLRTNYKVYGQSSPFVTASSRQSMSNLDDDHPLPSSSHSNYRVLADSSSSSNQSVYEQPRPQTSDTDANYVVHGGPSASSLSLASTKSRLRSEYSRESLVVAPLRTIKRRASDSSSLPKPRSRDSHRTGSLSSISHSITDQATRALFAGAAVLNIQPRFQRPPSQGVSPILPALYVPPAMTSYPHQWSSQLSTVFSESEGGSEPATRSVSPLSAPGRRSSGFSGFNSIHSRHILSISSLAGLEESRAGNSHSRSGSLDRPQPTYNRTMQREPNTGNIRLVRDHDEDGDGLADLQDLHHRPSRTHLSSMNSSQSSDRNIWSSSSSRANSLTNNSGIPVWAKLYYGSGERRLLFQPSSDSLFSQYNNSNRPGSSSIRSPSKDRFTSKIYNSRRPRDPNAPAGSGRPGSMDITSNPIMNVARGIKKQTSSIWSPHLQHDKRPARYGMWEPPSTVWSEGDGISGRRNLQVVLFVVGFIFPFAWMIAAVLPLPPNPQVEMAERLESTSDLDVRQATVQQRSGISDSRYRGARWWRNLNRIMSLVGILLIGTAIGLIIVGIREDWGR
ncbi:hypothetical protein S40293_00959 [Stachybotrys chartarum IBT 40293]|nr:hypothetical protein S40293_00959 [Stachybotrys chartarum IBT 40293]